MFLCRTAISSWPISRVFSSDLWHSDNKIYNFNGDLSTLWIINYVDDESIQKKNILWFRCWSVLILIYIIYGFLRICAFWFYLLYHLMRVIKCLLLEADCVRLVTRGYIKPPTALAQQHEGVLCVWIAGLIH